MSGSLGPKRTTTRAPTATARCAMPESGPTRRPARARTAAVEARLSRPQRSRAPEALATVAATAQSSFAPTRTQGGGERGVAVCAPALARNRPARMQRDKALRETVGREREAFGGDRARPRQEGDGRNAERGGEDASELRVLGPLQVVGDGVRVKAETGGGDVEAHAERGLRPGGENGREAMELLRVEDGGIVAAA